jgi:hypothetical protein
MDRRTFLKSVPAFAVLAAKGTAFAQEAAAPAAKPAATQPAAGAAPAAGVDSPPIVLLKPQAEGGKSVLAALWERKTNRNIKEDKLPAQMLSDLLFAAAGVNRPAGAGGRIGRTFASASNSQEVDVYVLLAEGAYLYEAVPHRLTAVAAGDLRALASRRQGAGAKAPVRLVFVADLAKFANGRPQEPGLKDPEIQKSYYNIATGLIAGNVYLFAASQGLAAWFHNCDKPGLTTALKLRPDQRALYAQTVGYPA